MNSIYHTQQGQTRTQRLDNRGHKGHKSSMHYQCAKQNAGGYERQDSQCDNRPLGYDAHHNNGCIPQSDSNTRWLPCNQARKQ